MLLYDSKNDLYVILLSMRVTDTTAGSVYHVSMNKSLSSFTLESTIFGVFVGNPSQTPY